MARELIAADSGTHTQFVWWAQRRSYLRNTLRYISIGVRRGDTALQQRQAM
jgi:hypothetical protein